MKSNSVKENILVEGKNFILVPFLDELPLSFNKLSGSPFLYD